MHLTISFDEARDANALRPDAIAVTEVATLLADDHGLHVAGQGSVSVCVRRVVRVGADHDDRRFRQKRRIAVRLEHDGVALLRRLLVGHDGHHLRSDGSFNG